MIKWTLICLQILQYANTSLSVCADPYAYACDNFEREYMDHEAFGLIRGEWNYKANEQYNGEKGGH